MILTCLNPQCGRQHDYPDGWPARAALTCWECETLHLAEKANTVRLATEKEVAGFEGVEAFRDQRRVAAWARETFNGRKGMIPWREYTEVATRAAKELGITVHSHGGLAGLGVAAVDKKTGEVTDVSGLIEELARELGADQPEDFEFNVDTGCMHCLLNRLLLERGRAQSARRARGLPHIAPADDIHSILRTVAALSTATRNTEWPIDEYIAAMTGAFEILLRKELAEAGDTTAACVQLH